MELPVLNRQTYPCYEEFPIKALQIGEGNFIRAFVDWMIDECNQQKLFQGSVVVTQPRKKGSLKIKKLKEQDGLFTLVLRGLEKGKRLEQTRVISCITRTIDPYNEWKEFMTLADNPNIEFIFSNTTEAGITYFEEELDFEKPIHSFPGKLTAFLFKRFQSQHTQKGFIILPCELLERAGNKLLSIVLKHARNWHLGEAFEQWVKEKNVFLNSLVDRIVTGYPDREDEILQKSLGYQDKMLTVAEPYHQWVIEGNKELAEKLPFHKAGLNVEWVDDLDPYIKRKVRILNGAHTFMLPIAYIKGYDIVREAVEDDIINHKLNIFLNEIVTYVLPFKRIDIELYIRETIERFRNPYIDHRLLDIALNSTSKFCTRLLPTLVEYIEIKQKIPKVLIESLAYLIRFYWCQNEKGEWWGWRLRNGEKENYLLMDSEQVLSAFSHYWREYERHRDVGSLVRSILSSKDIWPTPIDHCELGSHYSEICKLVTKELTKILKESIPVMKEFEV